MGKKLKNTDRNFLVNKIEKKMDSWNGKLLSLRGSVTLIKLVLCTIYLYWMTLIRIYVLISKKIEKLCMRFQWFGENSVRKRTYC
jgi:hypothetical protein